jgi:short-subunit dehydrogenase
MPPQTALVTGASSGIGRALAHLFARDGYGVVLVGRQREPLEAVRREIALVAQAPVSCVTADLGSPDGADLLHADVLHERLTIDVLVNNAGVGMQGHFLTLPLDRQLQMMTLNMTSLVTLTRLLTPGMVQRRRGGVLNVGSIAAFQPGPFMAVYYAKKSYVVSFSDALADELTDTGVVVSCLAPGPTATGFAAEAGATRSRLFRGDMMAAEEVARIGYDGWKRGKPLVIAGRRNRVSQMLVRILPRAYVRGVVRRLNTEG